MLFQLPGAQHTGSTNCSPDPETERARQETESGQRTLEWVAAAAILPWTPLALRLLLSGTFITALRTLADHGSRCRFFGRRRRRRRQPRGHGRAAATSPVVRGVR